MLLSTTKELMITVELLPSNTCPTVALNELVPWLMEGNVQPSVIQSEMYAVPYSIMCRSCAHTKLLLDTVVRAVSLPIFVQVDSHLNLNSSPCLRKYVVCTFHVCVRITTFWLTWRKKKVSVQHIENFKFKVAIFSDTTNEKMSWNFEWWYQGSHKHIIIYYSFGCHICIIRSWCVRNLDVKSCLSDTNYWHYDWKRTSVPWSCPRKLK